MVAPKFFTNIIFPCEFLTPKDLVEQQVPDLLAQTDTHVALKVSLEDLDSEDLKIFILQLRERGLKIILFHGHFSRLMTDIIPTSRPL